MQVQITPKPPCQGILPLWGEDLKPLWTPKIQPNFSEKFVLQNPPLIPSPLNYTGGKFRLLKQILPLFPSKINRFIDLFCGGGNVGINVCAKSVLYNDFNPKIIGILRLFKERDASEIISQIYNIIEKYGLSNSAAHGYAHYKCGGSEGLGAANKAPFLRLRTALNAADGKSERYFLLLYATIIFAFNNQIRFNAAGAFNLPVGKRDFNAQMQKKLIDFCERIRGQNCEFKSGDFSDILPPNSLKKGDFIYADPPYLITTASYNESGGWGEMDEWRLLDFLLNLDKNGVKFALSNVFESRGRQNKILQKWVSQNGFNAHHLTHSYANSNYQIKDRSAKTDEVLITNY